MTEQVDRETPEFFSHPSNEVAPRIAEKWYLAGQDPKKALSGTPASILIQTQSEILEYRVLLIEAHSASTPGRIWKGKRLHELQELAPGTIKAYASRAGTIPFIVAFGGDNLAIRALEKVTSGEKLLNASKVAEVLGLKHGEQGKLIMTDPTHFTYTKVEAR